MVGRVGVEPTARWLRVPTKPCLRWPTLRNQKPITRMKT